MTSKTLMPFGKWKGKPLSDVPRSYLDWLFDQDGAEEKYPDLFTWYAEGGDASPVATAKEVNINFEEDKLLLSMPTPFRTWWDTQYGRNLTKVDSAFRLPYLRVAMAAWQAASEQLATAGLGPITPSLVPPSMKASPPPPPPKKPTPTSREVDLANISLDEDVPF
jgi:hypothetical protein